MTAYPTIVSSNKLNLTNIPTDLNDIIFAGRNKEYGAYLLRKNYKRNILIASIIGIGLSISTVGASIISNMMNISNLRYRRIETPFDFTPPPIIDPETVILPHIELPPPPVVNSVRFLPPEITDRDVTQELPPTQDDMIDRKISSVNIDGPTTDDIIVEPVEKNTLVGESKEEKIFTIVEIKPSYPGGFEALSKYLSKNLRYPASAQKVNAQGRVYLTFVVNSLGEISKVEVLKGIGFGCDEEATRVVQGMPKWTPGKQGGRNVSVKFTLPISFALQKE